MGSPFFPAQRKGYSEVTSTSGKSETNIFIKRAASMTPGQTKKPEVKWGHTDVRVEKLTEVMGDSAFQLFLTIHVDERTGNRFSLGIAKAEVDSRIRILPKEDFSKLEAFGPIYEKFAATASLSGDWRTAADEFAEQHIMRHKGQKMPDGTMRGGHWAPSFTGTRAATVRHELDHVRFAVAGCQALIENFLREVNSTGKAGHRSKTAENQIQDWIGTLMGRLGFPYFDVGAKEHKAIAKRDVMFMVAWYEYRVLKLMPMNHAAYEAMLAATHDTQLSSAMTKLGEDFPWL